MSGIKLINIQIKKLSFNLINLFKYVLFWPFLTVNIFNSFNGVFPIPVYATERAPWNHLNHLLTRFSHNFFNYESFKAEKC